MLPWHARKHTNILPINTLPRMHTVTASLLLISYWMSVCCRQSKSSPFTLEGLIHTSQGRSCLISCQWGWWRGRVEGYRKGVRVWIMARHNMESQSFSFTTHTNDTIHDSKSDYSCDLTWWLLFNSFQSLKKKKKITACQPSSDYSERELWDQPKLCNMKSEWLHTWSWFIWTKRDCFKLQK